MFEHSARYAKDQNNIIQYSGWRILKVMWKHVWPKDKPSLKVRVLVAVGLLVGAKV